MDPDGNVGGFPCPIEGILGAVVGTPPMGGCAVPPHHNKGLPIFKVDDHSSRPLDESSTVVASWSQPLLSILAPVAHSSNSQGGSSYGHNLPRDIPVMLPVSPQTAGSAFGYIFLAINEHIHQDSLLAFFDNAGRAVHVLPCPGFEVFLQSNFISTCNDLFVTNLPPHMILVGHHILEEDTYSMDAAPNLSWLPEIPLALTFSRTS
jgi:hypothetical protein